MVLWVWYFSLRTMKMPCLPVLPMIWSHLEFACRLSWAQQSKCASMHQFFTVDLWNEVGHNLQHMYDTITDTIEVNMHPEMLVLPVNWELFNRASHKSQVTVGKAKKTFSPFWPSIPASSLSCMERVCEVGKELPRCLKRQCFNVEEARNFIYQLYPVNILLS